jgi:hypothetical protein
MLTCKSPRKVLLVAYHAARRILPRYSCKFSRHDFTWAQLFACLVVREHQRKSYRGLEALLCDVPWCRKIGLRKVPDHNTLCRAFHAIMSQACVKNLLDLLARLLDTCKATGITLSIDSTYLDTHHQSRHYVYRCRPQAGDAPRSTAARQAARVAKIPKLSLAVDVATHLIVAARTQVGMSGDHRDFPPLLRQACARVRNVTTVLADRGYDSHANHVVAREELGVCSLIRAKARRPGTQAAASDYRKAMECALAGSQAGKTFGQRAQVETVNSMIKRNLGDSLRAKSESARAMEQLLRVITHNLMIPRCPSKGRDRAVLEPTLIAPAWIGIRNFHIASDVLTVLALWAMECRRWGVFG